MLKKSLCFVLSLNVSLSKKSRPKLFYLRIKGTLFYSLLMYHINKTMLVQLSFLCTQLDVCSLYFSMTLFLFSVFGISCSELSTPRGPQRSVSATSYRPMCLAVLILHASNHQLPKNQQRKTTTDTIKIP